MWYTNRVLVTVSKSQNIIIWFLNATLPYIPNFKSIFHPNDYKETHEVTDWSLCWEHMVDI